MKKPKDKRKQEIICWFLSQIQKYFNFFCFITQVWNESFTTFFTTLLLDK